MINQENFAKARLIARAIDHPVRMEILETIQKKGSITVSEIYRRHNMEQSVCSQHLAELRRAGIVETKRDGKYLHYTLVNDRIAHINNLFAQL